METSTEASAADMKVETTTAMYGQRRNVDYQYSVEELRTNESLALSVERIWFLQTELRPRIQLITSHLDRCEKSLSMRQTSEAIPLIPFEVDNGAFSGFVGVDGCFICKGEFAIKMPKGTGGQSTGGGAAAGGGKRSPSPAILPPPPTQSSTLGTSSSATTVQLGSSSSSTSSAMSASGSMAASSLQQTSGLSSSAQGQWTYRTTFAAGMSITLTDVQDSYNLVRLASDALHQASLLPPSDTAWTPPIEVPQALEWTVKAWDLLTHSPAEQLFPNRMNPSLSKLFDPPTPDEVVIEACVTAGEAILHAYVLRIDQHSKSKDAKSQGSQKGIFSKLESTDTVQIAGVAHKSFTFTDGSVAVLLAHHEVHILAPRLACAYRHLSYALGELSSLRDIIIALDN